MAKKTNNATITDNRVYPIKVRLIKDNPSHENKVMFNNIALYTFKDTIIEDVETLMKIQPLQKYLIIKSDVKESTNEVIVNDEIIDNEITDEEI